MRIMILVSKMKLKTLKCPTKNTVQCNSQAPDHFRNEYGRNSNSFLSSVYGFYEKNGFITERQAKAVLREIW